MEDSNAVPPDVGLPPRYRLLRPLGRGGQGCVYLAADRFRGHSLVALKTVSWQTGRAPDTGRLAREFLTLKHLAHPDIARVRDFGILAEEAGAYYTSDYVAGGNLIEWAGEKPPDKRWRLLVDLAADTLSVLQYLSLREVVHGDIKPANLLVQEVTSRGGSRPLVKLIDFGTAALRGAALTAREAGGTGAYLPAPGARRDDHVDLHGLGMSLFHAAVGRLPFSLGEPGAVRAWHERREPARLTDVVPDVPPVLDDLVAGLTSPADRERFQSAAEALEQLRRRVKIAPLLHPPRASCPWTADRQQYVDDFVSSLTGASSTRRPSLYVLAGPQANGKTRVLEVLAGRLQVEGFHVLSFCCPGDPRPLAQARALAARLLGREGDAARLDLDEIVFGLQRDRVAVLLDDERDGDIQPFVRAWVSLPRRTGSPGPPSLAVAVSTRPDRLTRKLGLPRGAVDVRPLETLPRSSIAETAREFFAVETFPDVWTRRVEEASGGLAGRVLDCLERLAAAGMTADSLGEIHVAAPQRLEEALGRLQARAQGKPKLDSGLLRGLGLLLLAGEPVDPHAMAARFPEATAGQWHEVFEALHARGLVRVTQSGDAQRYLPTARGKRQRPEVLLGDEAAAAACDVLDRFFRERIGLPAQAQPGRLLAAARNLIRLRRPRQAARFAVLAARKLSIAQRDDVLQVLEEALEVAGREGMPPACRVLLACRLRAARICIRGDEGRRALPFLEPPGGAPRWFEAMARASRAEVHESLGNLKDAVRELEKALDPEPSPRSDLAALQAAGRLASLYHRTGRTREGAACLHLGRDILGPSWRARREAETFRFGVVLLHFARAESAHGDLGSALDLLKESLQLTRRLMRGDAAWGTLNELAILYARAQQTEDALEAFREAEERARERGNRLGAVKAVFNRAVLYYRLQRLDDAERLFTKARGLMDASGPHPLTAALWIGHAGVLRERGRLLESLRLYRKVLRLAAAVSPDELAIVHNNISDLYLLLGHLHRALIHADLAYRLARRIRDTFRIGLTLRIRGLVRWAAGGDMDAVKDLERALELARREGDRRGEGVAGYYLGLVAESAGDLPLAVRRLRAATVASRCAGDRKHLQAARVALLDLLLTRGRRKAARRILLEAEERPPGILAKLLALRASDDWPRHAPRALEVVRSAEGRADLWQTHRALRSLTRDPLLTPRDRRLFALERVRLTDRLARRLSPRRAARFRQAWDPVGGDSAAEADAGLPAGAREASREIGGKPEEAVPSGDAAAAGEDPTGCFLDLLDGLRGDLGASDAWLLGDPRAPVEPALAGGAQPVKLHQALSGHADSVEKARRTSTLVWDPPFLFAPLPHPAWKRVVCLEFPQGEGGNVASGALRRKLKDALSSLALCVRLVEKDRELAGERQRLEAVRKELYKLGTVYTRERQDLETALTTQSLENEDLRKRFSASGTVLPVRRTLVAASPALQSILGRLPRIAEQDFPVLIVGESGVGKDLFARCIHDLSPRRHCVFLAEICNVTESLMESELFGYVRGAFTGADKDRSGIFERADGGTIYLDEIAGLAPGLQSRLLRVLAEKKVRPVGAEESVPVDFRLISSSRMSLDEMQGSSLRKDLLYRINTEVIEIPPLREHKEDLRPLVQVLLREYASETGFPEPYVHSRVITKLQEHDWPGNVRELENTLTRILATRPVEITPEMLDLAEDRRAARTAPRKTEEDLPDLRTARSRTERELIERALVLYRGNATAAAKALGITRRHLGTLLSRYGIQLERFRQELGPR